MTVGYRLHRTADANTALQKTLNAKAKTDGEDVMTPLLLKAAEAILIEVTSSNRRLAIRHFLR